MLPCVTEVPAKKIKDISHELIHEQINRIADNYVRYAGWFKEADVSQ